MAGRRRARGGSRVTAAATRTPTPLVKQDESDEEMVDADVDATDARDVSAQPDEDDAATPANDNEALDEDEASSPPVVQSIPRRRKGPGRPPRSSRPGFESPDPNDDASESGTPFRRRRGRPSGGGGFRGGFRGRPKYGPKAQPDRVAIDKEGTMMDVVDDEVALPEDAEGETKVDKDGNLQDARDYRVRVFTIKGRANRLYMLSTEPARCTGFRDSYLFFTKHMALFKVILNDDEKLDLIARDIMPNSYKGRSIGVVTARSVFREFGARIVIGGKKIVDDYQTQAARERGDVEGELADPNDRLPPPGESYNKNQYVAWHGASSVYHTQTPSMPVATGKPITSKRKMNVTATNWQYEHAKEASKFNSSLTAHRRANLNGTYDTDTNLMLYPKIMQPSHVRWEQIPTPSDQRASKKTETDSFLTNGDLSNGHTVPSPSSQDLTHTIFPPINPVITRNYLITDTHFLSPAGSGLGIPGPDGDVSDLGPNGLSSISQDVMDELPADCRAAFEAQLQREKQWKSYWGPETRDGLRGKFRIGFDRFPV